MLDIKTYDDGDNNDAGMDIGDIFIGIMLVGSLELLDGGVGWGGG